MLIKTQDEPKHTDFNLFEALAWMGKEKRTMKKQKIFKLAENAIVEVKISRLNHECFFPIFIY